MDLIDDPVGLMEVASGNQKDMPVHYTNVWSAFLVTLAVLKWPCVAPT